MVVSWKLTSVSDNAKRRQVVIDRQMKLEEQDNAIDAAPSRQIQIVENRSSRNELV